jgi:diguanylate cyclase (GGDEF)-like protein/PAS domain S-box-containing protein
MRLAQLFHQRYSPLRVTQSPRAAGAEARFREVLDSAPDAVVICGPGGDMVLVNGRAEALFGYTRAELLGAPLEMLIAAPRGDRTPSPGPSSFADLRARAAAAGGQLYGRRRDGEEFPIELRLSPLQDVEGSLMPIAIRDVTERRRADEARAWLAAIVDSSSEAIVGLGPDGMIQSWNAGAERLYGYLPSEAIGRPASILFAPEHAAERERMLRSVLAGQVSSVHLESDDVAADGTRIAVALTASPIRDASGLIAGVARITRDVSERKRLEVELAYNADHDPLTALFNRRRFGVELAREVAHAERYPDTAGSLILADVDHFKYVNDTLGHRTGDNVLTAVAGALRGRLRETDVVARVGGDEFAVILTHTRVDTALTVARALCEAVGSLAPSADDHAVRTTLSIGIAPLGGGLSGDDSMAIADMAMYEAKKQGRDRVVGFPGESLQCLDDDIAPIVARRGGSTRVAEPASSTR